MTSVCPFQEKRIVNMAIVTLPIKVMILVSLYDYYSMPFASAVNTNF